MTLPTRFDSVEAVEDFMTTPSDALIADLARTPGDIMVLGVGGKMGPTAARLAKRAAPGKRVMGVARFSEPGVREALVKAGVEPISADLLDRVQLEKLPKAANVVFMAGRKFGAAGDVPLTWAMNVQVPAMVAEVFKESRIVAFSTGCVYPFVPVESGGASEDVAPVPPPGDYAVTCAGRGRTFDRIDIGLKEGNTIVQSQAELRQLLGPGFDHEAAPQKRAEQEHHDEPQVDQLALERLLLCG